MKKIILTCFLVVAFNANAVTVSTTAAIAASAAENNQRLHEQQQQLNQQRLKKINNSVSGLISGVFVCNAHESKERGYYGEEYTKCDFWNRDDGYYSVSIEKVPEMFFPGKVVTSMFLSVHDKKFEFYYR